MKQTNNAIKFLMAQYRAIFNNAYFKGLATAALVTVAMAAGQAQAADGDLADFIKNSSKTDVKGDFTLSKTESLNQSAGGYLTNLTIANGGTLEFDGSAKANTGHIHVYETLSVQSGGTLTLKEGSGTGGWGVIGATDQTIGATPDFKSTSKLDVNGGTVSIDKSQIHMASVVLNNAKVEIKNNIGSAADSNFADNAQISAHAVYNAAGKHIEGTGLFTVTGDTTKITLDSGSILNAAVFNFDGGAIDMKGDETAGSGAMIRAYSNGGKVAAEINFQGTDLNITDSGNYIGGKVVNLKTGSDIKLADNAELHLSGILEAAGDIAASNHAGTINLDGATINLSGSNSKLIIDVEGSVFNANSGTINNKGEIKFNNKEVNTTAALLAGMAGGKITMASGGEINVTSGAVDISSNGLKFLQADGTVDANKLVLSKTTTLNAADLTLGKAFKASNLTLNADALKVGEGFTQNIGTITVANSLSGSKGFTVDSNSAAAVLNLKNAGADAATISGIETLTVKATDNTATLNIEGKWSGLNATAVEVHSGGIINLKGVDTLSFKSVDVKANGKLTLDGSNLTIAETVKNANETDTDKGVILSNNSSVIASYAKVTESDVIKNDLKKFNLDGTSKIVLTGRAAGVIEKTKLDAIKTALLGKNGQGLVEIQGATLSNTDAGITGNTATFDKAQDNSGVSGIYDDKTIVGANKPVSGSNSWGSVELADTKDNLEIASGASVTLNGVGGELVTKNDGNTTGGVALTQNATLSVKGNGELTTITASANNQGKALVNANLSVTGDIGSKSEALSEVNVQGGQLSTTGNIYTNNLVVDGAVSTTKDISATTKLEANGLVQAQNITAGSITVSDTVIADKVTLSGTSSVLSVGDSANTGLVEVGTLDLAGGKLLLDPAYGDDATIVALKDVTDETKDVVSAKGDIGVGMNSILAVGTTAAEAKALLTKLDFFSGVSLKQTNGAVLVANESLYIPTDKEVILDSTATNATLKTALTNDNSFKLGTGSALVVTDNLSSKTNDGSKAIIEFQTSGSATVTLEKNSQIAFESAISEQDKITLSNAGGTKTDNGVVITAAGGLLTGTLSGSQISFTLQEAELRKQSVNMSAPVQDLAIAALKGDGVDSDATGTQYIQTMTGLDGGKAVEETARLAVYGGAVQATNLAQQAANDAVVERMSRANPNGSLVFADNAQGGGLWLSPVYKSHESDSFDADGVDYGVDADLTGLVLGGDFTSESGVRAGAYFNFGSASIDGQGVGDKVSNDADYFGFGLYTGMTFGQMSLVADAGFTQVSNDIEQTPSAKISKVKADVDSSAVTLGLRGEYKLNVATMDVTPHLGVRYTRLAVDGYDAKADGYTVATTDVDTMQMFSIPFGVSISKNIVAGSWTVKPVFDLTLTANAGDTDAKLDTTFVGTKTIGLTSEAFDSFTYGATIGIDAKYGENFSVGLNTNYVGSSNTDEFGVMGNVRYMF